MRYSRKTKEQYVQSEIEGKATGWKAFYSDGKWQESGTPKDPTKPKAKTKSKSAAKTKKAADKKVAEE